jgi:hypothetical protein
VDACRIPYLAVSLGGVESLIEQPAIMSFYELTSEERLEIGIKDNLIRYAVGIEDADDLIADLAQALDRADLGAHAGDPPAGDIPSAGAAAYFRTSAWSGSLAASLRAPFSTGSIGRWG